MESGSDNATAETNVTSVTSTSLNITSMTTMPSSNELLSQAYHEHLMSSMPVIVWMCFLMVIGILGNALTISYYWKQRKKSSTMTLIVVLACVDLANSFGVSTTIADLFLVLYFTNTIGCKLMFLFYHFTIVISILIVWLISVDRYRKICTPMKKQLTPKTAIVGVGIIVIASILSSARDLYTFEPVQVNVTVGEETVTGYYCTNTDDENKHVEVWASHIYDGVCIFLIFLTFVFTYGNIWRVLRHHESTNTAVQVKKSCSTDMINDSIDRESDTPSFKDYSTQMNETVDLKIAAENGKETNTTQQSLEGCLKFNKPKKSAKLDASLGSNIGGKREVLKKTGTNRAERNMSIMMSIVSVGFLLCFVPYSVLNIGIRALSDTSEYELQPEIQFGIRLPFLNSVINPIIFCFFNPQFRRHVRDKLIHCRRSSTEWFSSE